MKIGYKINGKKVTREQFLKKKVGGRGVAMISRTYQDHKPLISEGLGCLPNQVPEMREHIRAAGIQGVHVRDNGSLEITSRRGRRELLRYRGLVDADGCYGD